MACWHDTELKMGGGSTCPPKHFSCVPHSEVHIHISYLFPDTIYCLDIVHVVPESVFYVFVSFFTLSVYEQHQRVIYTHISSQLVVLYVFCCLFICFVLFCFVWISLKVWGEDNS